MNERDKEGLAGYVILSVLFTCWATLNIWGRSFSRRYDLVQAHSMPDYLMFCGIGHKLLGRPLVLDLHDLSVELFESKWGRKKSKYLLPLVRFAERVSCKLATHLITTSHGFEEKLIERGNRKEDMTMVLNTANAKYFHYDGKRVFSPITSGARLLYHGTVAERYGLEMAVDALVMLREKIPGSRLEIYGKYDPSCRDNLERKIAQHGLHDAVTLGGWKSFEELHEIINRCDIGIVPYLSNGFMELALSTKTFEYAASGLPIVASRLRPVTSIFDDDAVQFFTPGDARDMADQIAALCLDAEAREQKVDKAELVVESISGAVMAERYVNLITALTERKR